MLRLIIRFRVMHGRTAATRQRAGRPNNHPILSDWTTVLLRAEWGNEVHTLR